MKNWKKRLSLLAATILFAGGFLFADPTVAVAQDQSLMSSPASNKQGKEKDNTNIKDKYVDAEPSNLSKWFTICNNVGKTLKTKGFHYSNSEGGRTLAASLRGSRACNCANYVSWCMQEYGALKRGKTFYARPGSGHPSRKLGSKVKVIRKYKTARHAGLQPGDIVCFATPHTCIYAGRNKKGKMLWFDQGKVATYGNASGARYKSYGARQENYLCGSTVCYVVRIKDIKK